MITLLLAATTIAISSPVLAGGDDYVHGELEQTRGSAKTVLRAIDAAFSYNDVKSGHHKRPAFNLDKEKFCSVTWEEEYINPYDYADLKVQLSQVYVNKQSETPYTTFKVRILNGYYEANGEVMIYSPALTTRGKEIFNVLYEHKEDLEIINPGFVG